MMELPADQLVFLAALAAIAAAEPIFEGFLYPAITSFANGWVAHCRGDSLGSWMARGRARTSLHSYVFWRGVTVVWSTASVLVWWY
ncbi:hypothetical protein B0H11DRAFT_1959756 [Mycena galericulata]|nr:hypothetical protein B0H11DRAFT_1959756 [Mycena galericulata]